MAVWSAGDRRGRLSAVSPCHVHQDCRHMAARCGRFGPIDRLRAGAARGSAACHEEKMSASRIISGALQTERRHDGKRKLLRPLIVDIGASELTIHRGFVTDFSSIPTLFQWVVRWSRVDVAGVVHDYLYARGALNRWQADWIWFEIARSGDHCANFVQAVACWLALRLCGWCIWCKAANRRRRAAKRRAVPKVRSKRSQENSC